MSTHLNPRILSVFLALMFMSTSAIGQEPGYYDSVDSSTAINLRSTLHGVIDDHQRFPYTSSATDTWDILEIADENPDSGDSVITIYRNASYIKQGGGNDFYNREHSWPKSYGFPNDGSTNYPYTDAHHLFIADSGYNSSRSNKPFADCGAACAEKPTDFNNGRGGMGGTYPGDSNWTAGSFSQGSWEVWPGRRGDIARALMYMDIRYEGGDHGVTGIAEPNLVLTDNRALIEDSNVGSNTSVAYMGLLSVLLAWHEEDPVDYVEQARNEAVASFQGNRNPFIDHPEWADCLYLGQCDGGGQGGGSAWINEFHYDNKGGDKGEFVEVAGTGGLDLSGWTLVAYNGADGSSYASVLLGGVIPEQQGCMGTAAFTFSGLQNGAPDGIVLLDASGNPVDGVAYEGSFTTTDGQVLQDVGVAENSRASTSESLQLTGTGSAAAMFSWHGPVGQTRGTPNQGQQLDGCGADTTPPAAPAGLMAIAQDAQVELDWSGNSEPDLLGYHVYRSSVSGGSYQRISGAPLPLEGFIDTGLTNGETYYYAVSAIDGSGNESGLSEEVSATPSAGPDGGGSAWINEFHYDNDGTDTGEFVEIAGAAGLDLSGWRLVGYNGNGGTVYGSIQLSGAIPDIENGFGILDFSFPDLQNGAPDGIALIDPADEAVDWLAYEGSLTAVDGPLAGQVLGDIGVAETSTTPVGWSLARTGSGTEAAAFLWSGPSAASRGSVNVGQDFGSGSENTAPSTVISAPGDAAVFAQGDEVVFEASAMDAEEGDLSASLEWNSSIDGLIGFGAVFSTDLLSAGVHVINASVTDAGGLEGAATISLNIVAPPSVTIDSFTAAPVSIIEGSSSTLTWAVSNATDCQASGEWSGTKNAASGSESVTPSTAGEYTYTLTCTGDGFVDSASVTVAVTTPPPVSIDVFQALPGSIVEGESSTLSWSVSHATSCTASGAWGGLKDASSGSETVNPGPIGQYAYTLSCEGAGAPDSAVVQIVVEEPATALSLSSITPDVSSMPDQLQVTVSGGGLTDGAVLALSGGSGPAPVVSNTAVLDASTLTATVTIKSGGPNRTRTWDVVVSLPDGQSAILPGAFRVIP